jgi:type IV pilus assembly protein PilA
MKAPKIVKKAQAGFTLIELMIVVAIIGVLAAVAIPAYQDYTVKSKWAANVAELEGVKQAIKNCLGQEAGVGTACDTVGELQPYGYAGSALPQPKYATAAVTLTGSATAVNIGFTGASEAKSLVYNADCAVGSDGNIACTAVSGTDTIGNYMKGTGR